MCYVIREAHLYRFCRRRTLLGKVIYLPPVTQCPVQTADLPLQLTAAVLRCLFPTHPLHILSHHEVSLEPLRVAFHQPPLLSWQLLRRFLTCANSSSRTSQLGESDQGPRYSTARSLPPSIQITPLLRRLSSLSSLYPRRPPRTSSVCAPN